MLCSGHPKHPKGIYCAGEQQSLLKELRPENTPKKRAKKQEKKVMVSKYQEEGPGLQLPHPPAPRMCFKVAETEEQVLKYSREKEKMTGACEKRKQELQSSTAPTAPMWGLEQDVL